MADLKHTFTGDQISFCAAVGEGGGTLPEKITKIFSELPDPLLSQAEIKSLLRTPEPDEDHLLALDQLCRDGMLEVSDKTQRPLDTEENLKLYRKNSPTVTR